MIIYPRISSTSLSVSGCGTHASITLSHSQNAPYTRNSPAGYLLLIASMFIFLPTVNFTFSLCTLPYHVRMLTLKPFNSKRFKRFIKHSFEYFHPVVQALFSEVNAGDFPNNGAYWLCPRTFPCRSISEVRVPCIMAVTVPSQLKHFS